MTARVVPLLDPDSSVASTRACTCAIFYSISSCQRGLRGFAFGNLLLVRAMEELKRELPRLDTFATLSPIPGFRTWLSGRAASLDSPELAALAAKVGLPDWPADSELSLQLETELMPLCAHYLLHVKQGADALDPVARFHLGNGACLCRINWLGDASPAGLQRSAGLSANYLYRPADLSRNARAYATTGAVLATPEIERLASAAPRA
jgi:malonyl-CoA decarboxylase